MTNLLSVDLLTEIFQIMTIIFQSVSLLYCIKPVTSVGTSKLAMPCLPIFRTDQVVVDDVVFFFIKISRSVLSAPQTAGYVGVCGVWCVFPLPSRAGAGL